jgi:hypothetical protein
LSSSPLPTTSFTIGNEITTVNEDDLYQPTNEDTPISTDDSVHVDQSADLTAPMNDTPELEPATVVPEAKQEIELTDEVSHETVTVEKTAADERGLLVHVPSGSVIDTDIDVALSSSFDEELSLGDRRYRYAGAIPSPRSSRTSRTRATPLPLPSVAA